MRDGEPTLTGPTVTGPTQPAAAAECQPAPRRSKRTHRAASARILATGVSLSAMFTMVSAMASGSERTSAAGSADTNDGAGIVTFDEGVPGSLPPGVGDQSGAGAAGTTVAAPAAAATGIGTTPGPSPTAPASKTSGAGPTTQTTVGTTSKWTRPTASTPLPTAAPAPTTAKTTTLSPPTTRRRSPTTTTRGSKP